MASYYTDPTTGERVKIQKTHRFRNFVVFPFLGVIALVVIIAAASGGGAPAGKVPGNGPAVAADTGSSSAHVVRYEVEGSGTGMITYITDANMSMSQETGASLPWSQEVTIDSWYAPVNFSVQHSTGSGPITCRILIDGKVVSENHASGAYAMASCSATIK